MKITSEMWEIYYYQLCAQNIPMQVQLLHFQGVGITIALFGSPSYVLYIWIMTLAFIFFLWSVDDDILHFQFLLIQAFLIHTYLFSLIFRWRWHPKCGRFIITNYVHRTLQCKFSSYIFYRYSMLTLINNTGVYNENN
jgi:hypothetical protein